MTQILKKRCVTVQKFKKGSLPYQKEVKGERFTFWIDQSMSKGFEVRLEGDGIEVRGMGIPPGITIEPGVSNVVHIKLRRQQQ